MHRLYSVLDNSAQVYYRPYKISEELPYIFDFEIVEGKLALKKEPAFFFSKIDIKKVSFAIVYMYIAQS